MQHDNGRRVIRRKTDHAIFKIGGVDAEEAGGGKSGHCGRAFRGADGTFPPPLWGRDERSSLSRVRERGKPQAPPLRLPPSPTLPQRKSGLPDLRKTKRRNRGKPRLRGGEGRASFAAAPRIS